MFAVELLVVLVAFWHKIRRYLFRYRRRYEACCSCHFLRPRPFLPSNGCDADHHIRYCRCGCVACSERNRFSSRCCRTYPSCKSKIHLFLSLDGLLFTIMARTGNIAFALLPVIANVSRETGVCPERPMSISVVASQQAITASPVSAAMAA